tara:strand:- start:61 stop:345 length:285 start_codon:yes stop_codon:yes gene_type:complete
MKSVEKIGHIGLDKFLHFIEYCLLGLLAVRAFNKKKEISRIRIFIYGIIFSCFHEIWQSIIPSRNPSLNDIIADTLGLALGINIGTLLFKKMSW